MATELVRVAPGHADAGRCRAARGRAGPSRDRRFRPPRRRLRHADRRCGSAWLHRGAALDRGWRDRRRRPRPRDLDRLRPCCGLARRRPAPGRDGRRAARHHAFAAAGHPFGRGQPEDLALRLQPAPGLAGSPDPRPRTRVPDLAVRHKVGEGMADRRGGPGRVRARALCPRRAAGGPGPTLRQPIRAERTLEMPVLALGAEAGVGGTLLDTMRLVAAGACGGTLAGCGHYMPEERPATVAGALLRFLSSEATPERKTP